MAKAKMISDKFLNEQFPGEFLDRLRSSPVAKEELDNACFNYGELPVDVLEDIARQQAAARPILEKFHLLAELAPTLAVARATMLEDIDDVMDIVTAMDTADLTDDENDGSEEYNCPKCRFTWSGDSERQFVKSGVAFIPTGRVSMKTGRINRGTYGSVSANR